MQFFGVSPSGLALDAMRFSGSQNSYALITNDGSLDVGLCGSFTWAAYVYPTSPTNRGPLFNWLSTQPGYDYLGTHLWYDNRKITMDTPLDGSSTFRAMFSTGLLNVDTWNVVAFSYDSISGDIEVSVNGNTAGTQTDVQPGLHSTYGNIVIGSRYYFSSSEYPDPRHFDGMIACVRLWSGVAPLSVTVGDEDAICGVP